MRYGCCKSKQLPDEAKTMLDNIGVDLNKVEWVHIEFCVQVIILNLSTLNERYKFKNEYITITKREIYYKDKCYSYYLNQEKDFRAFKKWCFNTFHDKVYDRNCDF